MNFLYFSLFACILFFSFNLLTLVRSSPPCVWRDWIGVEVVTSLRPVKHEIHWKWDSATETRNILRIGYRISHQHGVIFIANSVLEVFIRVALKGAESHVCRDWFGHKGNDATVIAASCMDSKCYFNEISIYDSVFVTFSTSTFSISYELKK